MGSKRPHSQISDNGSGSSEDNEIFINDGTYSSISNGGETYPNSTNSKLILFCSEVIIKI